MSKPMVELKDRLKKALLLSGIKPIELSEKTGIPKSAISQYASGYTKPKQDRIYLISKALNVSEAWLMGYDVPMERMSEELYEHKNKMKNFANEWNLKFNEKKLVTDFRKLNDEGQKEALKQVENLTCINKYIRNNIDELDSITDIEVIEKAAANADKEITQEELDEAVLQTLNASNKHKKK